MNRISTSSRFRLAALTVMMMTGAAVAQTLELADTQARLTAAISISSDRARIQELLPKLRENIARKLTDRSKGVHVIALQQPSKALADARERGCDYLLEIKVSQLNQVEVELNGGRPAQAEAVSEPMGKNIEGEIRISYKFVAVKGEPVKIQDDFPVARQEYPLEQDPTAFETVVIRSTTAAASAAMKQLEKKKGL